MSWINKKLCNYLGVTQQIETLENKVSDLEQNLNITNKSVDNVQTRIDNRIAELNKLTAVDADLCTKYHRGNNTIVLTGVYRGRAYAQ